LVYYEKNSQNYISSPFEDKSLSRLIDKISDHFRLQVTKFNSKYEEKKNNSQLTLTYDVKMEVDKMIEIKTHESDEIEEIKTHESDEIEETKKNKEKKKGEEIKKEVDYSNYTLQEQKDYLDQKMIQMKKFDKLMKITDYKIIDFIASGKQSAIFKCEVSLKNDKNESEPKLVAMKLMLNNYLSTNSVREALGKRI